MVTARLESGSELNPPVAPPPSTPRRRIPSLDGVRALAIACVCVGHLTLLEANGHPNSVARALVLQDLGVRIFFVLSGFLITTLLLTEFERTDTINLPRFYLRRSLRIFPAFYAFVVLVSSSTALVG